MNKTITKKTSGLLATLLILSMLVPALASAGIYFSGTFSSNGTVSGNVYFNNDGDTVGDDVYGQNTVTVGVYSKNGEFIRTLQVTKATYEDGTSYYSIPSTVLNSVYDAIYFKYDNSVTENVYRQPSTPCTYCGGGIGGGGGFIPPTNGSVIEASNGTVNANDLKNALDKFTDVTIKVNGDLVSIPVSALLNAKEGSILNIVTDHGAYILPLDAFDFEVLAKQIDSSTADLKLNIGIKKLTGDEAKAVSDAISALGGKQLADAVDFSISIEGKDGKKAAIDSFDRYIKRKLPLSEKPSVTGTVALFNTSSKTLSFVPGQLSDTEAEFWRNGNSVYTALELSKSFTDVTSHWGKSYIDLLAGKLIIDGVTDTTFEPDRNITRAEFAALIVRSLGLSTVSDATYFNDVNGSDWYAGVVGAAAKAGLVDGYEDSTFRPNAQITREELAAIVVRAYKYAGGKTTVDASTQAQILSKWSDSDRIVWGHKEVAQAIASGLMNGMTDTTLETYGQATRAQTAAMLKRFLSEVNFIE
ncbi:S-layer homology domain-containing protein [Paenibacillus sp. GYB004]|uniref:S-layer homology domain-containing protein n=1 Tax=Paenibacillus sp. GYB004 TaxID=2994393 RepID=UPI002F966CC6